MEVDGQMKSSQLLVGTNVGINSIHTILVREEIDGRLKMLGEHRDRELVPRDDPDSLLQHIQYSIQEAIDDAHVWQGELLTIGVALPGQIDTNNEQLLFAPNLNVRNVPLAAMLKEHFDCPVALLNDVNSQGIGEYRIGVGEHQKHLVYLFVSYGIGSCIILDGKLYTGADNLAGEFGHIVVSIDGPVCGCGQRGCLEGIASRRAMIQTIQAAYKEGCETVLANMVDDLLAEPLDINSALLAEAIDLGDSLTTKVVQDAADTFSLGLASIINLLNPSAVILGGDVIDDIGMFFDRAVGGAKARALSDFVQNLSILAGGLGTTAGAYGAAVFAKEHLS